MKTFCNNCARQCNIDRTTFKGFCGETNDIRIAKYYLHPFEEPIISGKNGSGTVFFCGCSLRCVFCQNYDLSRSLRGKTITKNQLAKVFKTLEDMGAENINLVTPTHYAYQIIDALEIYKPKIPIVYNTHSFESLKVIKDLMPYIDIFLPDLKFKKPVISKRYTGIENYFNVASENILYMMENKPTVIKEGKALSGVIVRHLILPLCRQDSVDIINWFNSNQKNNAYLSVMSQYTPYGDYEKYPELKRKITKAEYATVIDKVLELKIKNCFIQDLNSASEQFIPKWDY